MGIRDSGICNATIPLVNNNPRTPDLDSSPTVLLVDDDAQVRDIIQRVLVAEGVRVVEARHGQEALDLFRKEPRGVDLLLTDIDMPGMSGVALSAELARLQHHLKTVYVSGFPDLIAEADHIPANQFLQKPFTAADLSRKVRAALNTPLQHWQCPRCGSERYQGLAADNDGQSQTLIFICMECHAEHFSVAESMYTDGAKCPFCCAPTVPSGYGFVGMNGQFYLGLQCHRCEATIVEHSPSCPAIPW